MASINQKAVLDITRFIEKAKAKPQEITKQVLLEVGKRLVQRSPVGNPELWKSKRWPKGYIPGHFINNWQLGIDEIPSGIIQSVDKSGQQSLERLAQFGDHPVGHKYYFVNNLPYAVELEMGHSTQAPLGMVGLTALEFPDIVNEVQNKA